MRSNVASKMLPIRRSNRCYMYIFEYLGLDINNKLIRLRSISFRTLEMPNRKAINGADTAFVIMLQILQNIDYNAPSIWL